MNPHEIPNRRDRVIQALKEHGPLDVRGIAAATDLTVKDAASMVRKLRRFVSPPLHIHQWASYGCATYKWGQGVDAPRPPIRKPRRPPNKKKRSGLLLSPRLQIPAAPLPPLAWMTTQPTAQMSARW